MPGGRHGVNQLLRYSRISPDDHRQRHPFDAFAAVLAKQIAKGFRGAVF
jgi:hypothetical protein